MHCLQICFLDDALHDTEFRNCMMHYDLKNNGVFVITEDNFDEKKLLYVRLCGVCVVNPVVYLSVI